MRAVIIAGLVGLVNACATNLRTGPAVQERPWHAYLGSPARASTSPEALGADPQPVWRTRAGRGAAGALALGEDVVALAAADRQVILLDRTTGAVLWRKRLAQHIGAGPLLADDRLFVATQDDRGHVYAIRLIDGGIIWSRNHGEMVAPLALDAGMLYGGTLDGVVSAIRTDDGQRRWHVRVNGAVRAAIVPTAMGIVVGTAADSLYLLARDDGRVLARRGTRGAMLGAAALTDSLLVFGTSGGRIEAVDPGTLTPRWTHDLDGPMVGHVAVRDGIVFALTARGTLWRIPLAGGPAAAATTATALVSRVGPQPVAGGVLLASVGGELVLLDAAGQRRWSARLGSAVMEPPLVENGAIVTLTLRGEVVLFR